MILLLAIACSTLDPLTSSPFDENDCAFTLEDAESRDEICLGTRPYYEMGASVSYSLDEYDTFDLIVSAAPEGGVGMDTVRLAVSATPSWNLEDVLTIEYPDGDVRGVDLDEDGDVEIDADAEFCAGDGDAYTLIFDHAGLDTPDNEYLYVGFDTVQTWHQEGADDLTTKFQDLGPNGWSTSLGVEF